MADPVPEPAPPTPLADADPRAEDAYDAALGALAGTAPEFGAHGLSNHGPMVAEVLVQLGRPEAVGPWVARYRTRLEPAPAAGRPLVADEWQDALGDRGRFADWVATFDVKLADEPFADVLARWVPRLAPGLVGGAGHGLLRTAHATRALGRAEGPARRAELAQGLAYWAAAYQELPGPPLLVGPLDVPRALEAVPPVPEEARPEDSISAQLGHLDMIAKPFEQAVAALATPHRLLDGLDALAVAGCAAYLANADAGAGIPLVHAVTVPMALELVVPVVDPDDAVTAFAYAWQAAAALHAAFARIGRDGTEPPVTDRPVTDRPATDSSVPDPPAPDDLVTAAVDSGDEHAIKLTEAGLRVHARDPAPVLLEAAADAASRFAVT